MRDYESLEFTELPTDSFSLPWLDYAYDALEPHLGAKEMFYHHALHHRQYVDRLNDFVSLDESFRNLSLFDLLTRCWRIKEVRRYGGGHYNHSLLWKMLTPDPQELDDGLLLGYGTLEFFKERVLESAGGVFGSGWVWLVVNRNRDPVIYAMDGQDNPLMRGDFPVWGLDLWEHAYYKRHGPDREGYIGEVFRVTNWGALSSRFERALMGDYFGWDAIR
jgi:Fe-Mn family superoxide dismutase